MSIQVVEKQSLVAPVQAVARQLDKDVSAAAPAVEEKVADQEEMLSPKYAALARQEKAIRAKAREIKAREEALKSREQEVEQSYVPKSKIQERLQQDPMGFLSENGISLDQMANLLMNGPKPEELYAQRLESEIKAIKSDQEKTKTQFAEQQKKAYDQAVNQIRTKTKVLIDADPAYEMIKAEEASEAVVELIRETYEQEGFVLEIADAAQQIEDYLLDEALRKAQIGKVKARLTPQEPEIPEATKTSNPKQTITQTPMKTLTNAQAANSSTSLSARDRRDRAILAFQGKL